MSNLVFYWIGIFTGALLTYQIKTFKEMYENYKLDKAIMKRKNKKQTKISEADKATLLNIDFKIKKNEIAQKNRLKQIADKLEQFKNDKRYEVQVSKDLMEQILLCNAMYEVDVDRQNGVLDELYCNKNLD